MPFVLLFVFLICLLGTADAAFAAIAVAAHSAASAEPVRLAYLDPGSGSFLVQALIAMFAVIIVTSRMYWSKIKSFLGLGGPAIDDEDEDDV